MKIDVPTNKGFELLKLSDYIARYRHAKHSMDKGYLDQEKTIHILDLFDNFINDYPKEHTVKIVLSEIEKDIYRYNPKALSYHIYETPDMWEVIMRANNLDHPGEMDFSKDLYVPTIEALEEFFVKLDEFKESIGGEWLDMKDSDLFQ